MQVKAKHDAAAMLQQQMRLYLSRRRVARRRRAVQRIQRMALRHELGRRSLRLLDAATMAARAHEVHGPVEKQRKAIDSAVYIQRVERGFQGRLRVRRMEAAACIIQKYARRWLTLGRVNKRLCALAKMQALVDGAYRLRRKPYILSKLVRLQAYVRMFQARRRFRESQFAELQIARATRGGTGRAHVERQQAAAMILTRKALCFLAARRYRRQQRAAIHIQKICRGHLTREHLHEKVMAASLLASSWRRYRMETKHKAKRQAIDVMLGGTLMWRQVALRRRRIQAATTIAAAWRSYCVRVNLQLMHDAASKIQRTWRTLAMMHYTQDMAVEVLVRAKLMKEFYYGRHVRVIQRCWRRYLHRRKPAVKNYVRAITVLQSRYRQRKAAAHVELLRPLLGVRLRHYVQTPVVVYSDALGRLTRARNVLPEDNVGALPPPLRLRQMVHIAGMSGRQKDEVSFAIGPIQAMAKFQWRIQRVQDIQRVWRTYCTRLDIERRHQRATQIQAVWRAKLVRNQRRRAHDAATKIQAHVRRMLTMIARRKKTRK